jgi:hypothetical protein
MFIIGANPYGGLFTKSQFLKGKGCAPGTRASVTSDTDGSTKEFVAIKLSAATWINGTAIIIDGAAAPGSVVTTVSGNPAAAQQTRVGILVFASATATQTMAGTAFGWAQIYGECKAFVSASVSTPGTQLGAGAAGHLIVAVAQVSASGQLQGITYATATGPGAPPALGKVFLNYPCFSGLPDANLA